MSKLKEEQKVRFTLANEAEERTATVHLIGREISNDRTVRVHCHLDNEDTKLLPGMFLKAYIETGAAETYTLPETAIIKFEGDNYVYTLKERTDSVYSFDMLQVNIGSADKGYTVVTLNNQLNVNSNVVIDGGYSILAKMKNSGDDDHGH